MPGRDSDAEGGREGEPVTFVWTLRLVSKSGLALSRQVTGSFEHAWNTATLWLADHDDARYVDISHPIEDTITRVIPAEANGTFEDRIHKDVGEGRAAKSVKVKP